MELYDKLKHIYSNNLFELLNDGGSICEEEKDAKVTRVNVAGSGEMLFISKRAFDVSNDLYINKTENPPMELAHGCDGVVLTENENGKYIFLVELKSKYTWHSVETAYKQFMASYVKLSLILSLIRDSDIADYKVGALLVSLPITDETKTMMQKKIQDAGSDKYCFARFCMKLHQARRVNVKREDTPLHGLPIDDLYAFREFPVFHVDSPESAVTIHIPDYFSQI